MAAAARSVIGGYYAAVTSSHKFTLYLTSNFFDKVIHAPFNPFLSVHKLPLLLVISMRLTGCL